MKSRDDGLCPFCGTDVEGFPVCKNCNAEKIYSNLNTRNHVLWDSIYYVVWVTLLLIFRVPIVKFTGIVIYCIILIIGLVGLAFMVKDWFGTIPFTGFGWKRVRK